MDPSTWIPLRWPCGPLALDQARRRKGFTAAEADALAEWCRAESLERLAGTPVSCLALPWADGGALDAEQQRALSPLVAAAGKRGLSLVGFVAGGDPRRAAASAFAAGLAAIAVEGDPALADERVLPFGSRSLAGRGRAPFLGVGGLDWPGLRVEQPSDADATSGPTGPPWLDSNAWLVRLAKSLVDPRTLWLAFDPPELGQPMTESAYVNAIADTQVFGARWLVSLDPHLRAGLSRGDASALATWRGIARGLAFFEAHREWTGYEPAGRLGVVSGFAGDDEALAFEVLNLLSRLGGGYRTLEKSVAKAGSFAGLDAILYVDAAPPDPELARRLGAFAEEGGTLVTPPGWAARGTPEPGARHARFELLRVGRGRVAVSRAELADPFLLAEDALVLTSHRHDELRVFNPGAAQFHYAASGDGRSGVLHALRFDTPDPRHPLTAWFERPWTAARAWTTAQGEPQPVARQEAERGVEFTLDPLPGYSALELSSA